MTDLDELKALAEAATPGPWFLDAGGDTGVYTEARVSDTSTDVAWSYRREDEKFIAAANPAAVLDLIARVERAEAERVDLQRKLNTESANVTFYKVERDRYRDAIREALDVPVRIPEKSPLQAWPDYRDEARRILSAALEEGGKPR